MNIYDISRLSGVSIATVSRVINGSSRVRAQTREKVLRVIEENGYTPNAFARGLGLNTMHTVGLLCADSSDPYLAQAVCSLERELRTHGYDCLLCCTGYARENKEKYADLLLHRHVDGLIFVGSHFMEETPEGNAYIRSAAEKVPVVLLGGALEGENLFCVRCDERSAMRDAARRLLESGRERVLFLYSSRSFSSLRKLEGFREGCRLCGLSEEDSPALLADRYPIEVSLIRDLLLSLRREGTRFDAVLAADDRLAVGAIKYARSLTLRIPEDLQIIGCNNSPVARYCDPELTSIDNRLDALCHQSVSVLMDVLEGKDAPKSIVLPASLVLRASTSLKKEEE